MTYEIQKRGLGQAQPFGKVKPTNLILSSSC